jgi:DNA-binding CsgD family transcriptional regulator
MKTSSRPEWNLNAIGAAFSEAAIDPSRWNAAMESVAEGTGTFGAALFPLHGKLPEIPFSPSLAPSFEAYVRDGWIHRDERYRAVPAILRNGVATEFDFTNVDEIRRHPYYQEFLAPFHLRWAAFLRVATGDDVWCLTIQRTIEQGPFPPEDLRRLAGLLAPLASAAALARALGFARAEAALDAFELSGTAVVMLDQCGEVARVNRAAERILGRDLRIARRRLVSMDTDATAALDRAFHAALWSTEPPSLLPPVVLPRREGRPVLGYASRPSRIAADIFAACQIIVVLVDLEARSRLIESELRQAFKLTCAEARLANRVSDGESLERVADALGIAYETARNVLKSIQRKTDTHRQGELVALLGRFPFRDSGKSPNKRGEKG